MHNRRIKVLIVVDNIDFYVSIKETLLEDADFEVIGSANDGVTGLDMIRKNQVDVALIDILLPIKDGLFILEELRKDPLRKPTCIILSDVNQSSIIRKALQLGADYFIVKPFDLSLLITRVKEIYEFKNQSNGRRRGVDVIQKIDEMDASPDEYIDIILTRIPIPSNVKGFSYLHCAISLVINNGLLLKSVTKTLYPEVARLCGSTPTRVERAIRHALNTAWSKGSGTNYFYLTGVPNSHLIKPTNSEFIGAVANLYNRKMAFRPN
ncbi:MAG: sporulation transcription factor Spo0A [Clostridiales bacterium]|jgi:two-component system response regulator (stage 0 sporulation protein A)|nr:sporulation transcription factor Spo0A [Clostridiales bacterium]